jgi:predicted dehydrogenase
LKIGLIGCGRIANEAHVPAYPIAGTSLTAVCDLDNHRASAVAERTGASVSPDSLTLAQRDDVDIIDIATPPSQRPDLLRELIKVGKPILTQKPLSYDLNTAAALAREADDHGVVLAVNHNARWAPNHRAVYERLHNGDLGDELDPVARTPTVWGQWSSCADVWSGWSVSNTRGGSIPMLEWRRSVLYQHSIHSKRALASADRVSQVR